MAVTAGQIDHLVVNAPSLISGVAWVESILGVKMQAGGEHGRMATHNALLRLGDSVYLEVIAPNPAAPQPGRPRWFELDALDEDAKPRLATWVARTADIRAAVEACGYPFGSLEAMSRGRLDWLVTIPPDGSVLGGGAIPMLIEWTGNERPVDGIQDLGCRLSRLEIFYPDLHSISELLGCLGLRDEVLVRDLAAGTLPYVVAQIDTPGGMRTLSGRRE